MRAVQVTEFGGPEVLNLVDLPDPVAGPGQQLVQVDRIGVNYADTHQAENSYLAPSKLPLVPGGEIVGRTADGKRVVALLNGGGGYAERAVADDVTSFGVPDGVDDLTALSFIVQGTTASLLLRKSAHLEPGESVVVHAAAAWGRLHRRAAGESLGSGPGHRDRQQRRETCPRPRTRCRRRHRFARREHDGRAS